MLKITAKLFNFVTLSTFVVEQVLTFLLQQDSVLKLCDPFCVRLHASCLELRRGTSSMYIQNVPGGMCQTSGECSLGQTIPI